MIHSSIKDNWMRVQIMHSIAKSFYLQTNDSGFRKRQDSSSGTLLPFDTVQFETIEKETCIVGMVMAWCVITLESLVNHSLANQLNNSITAVMAIEHPGQLTDKLRIRPSARSELAKKIFILADDNAKSAPYMMLADELSEIRNSIVHDKPFDLIDNGDGEVEIKYFRSRGENIDHRCRYDDLGAFLEKCDHVKNFVTSVSMWDVFDLEEISFFSLMDGQ